MSKLWRRTPKVDRIPAALAAHFRAKPGVSINMGALMSRAWMLLIWLLCPPVAAALYGPQTKEQHNEYP